MRPVFLAVALMLGWASHGAISSAAVPDARAHISLPAASHACGQGYRCRDAHVQLCVKRPAGRDIWALTRKDVRLRRGMSPRGCTEYATGIGFTLRYNGKQAAVTKHSLRCAVQAQHGVAVVIRKCYAVVQRTGSKRFMDVVAGTRVCVRPAGYRGRGCHDDFAINVYAYPTGQLVGETFLRFKLRVSNL